MIDHPTTKVDAEAEYQSSETNVAYQGDVPDLEPCCGGECKEDDTPQSEIGLAFMMGLFAGIAANSGSER